MWNGCMLAAADTLNVKQGLKLKEPSAWNNSQLLRSNGFCLRFCRIICAGKITARRHVAFSHKVRTWLTFIQRGEADPSSRWSLNATHISFRHLCPLAFPGRLLLSMHRTNPADLNYRETHFYSMTVHTDTNQVIDLLLIFPTLWHFPKTCLESHS